MRSLHVRFCSVLVRETELWLTCSVVFGQNGKILLRFVTTKYNLIYFVSLSATPKKSLIFFRQKIEILAIVILVRTLESNLVRKWTTSGNYNHVKVGTNCTYYTIWLCFWFSSYFNVIDYSFLLLHFHILPPK